MKGKKLLVNDVNCTLFETVNNKICFVLSGTGYTYDKPALYYLTQLMIEKGYDVIQINYSFEKDLFKESDDIISQTIYDLVNRVVTTQLKKVAYEEVIFIGKSLGTIPIVNQYMQQNFNVPVKFINLTPLLLINKLYINLQQTNYRCLIIIGNSDPHYDSEKLKALSKHKIIVLPNANHSLDVANDVVKSIQILEQSIEEVSLFI